VSRFGRKATLDLPRFRGRLRAWDQGIWSDYDVMRSASAQIHLSPDRDQTPRGVPILPSALSKASGVGRFGIEHRNRNAGRGEDKRPDLMSTLAS
jgi:hypothetical protein